MASNGKSYTYRGVSGQPLNEGGFDYSATRQQESGKGPIPEGAYWIKPSEMWTNRWYNVALRSAWGNNRITFMFSPVRAPMGVVGSSFTAARSREALAALICIWTWITSYGSWRPN